MRPHPLARSRFSTADAHEKIETKYSSMVAHNYKTVLEKDVADACRRGFAALREGNEPIAAAPAVSSDPFADYINAIAPKPTRTQSADAGKSMTLGIPSSPAPPAVSKSLTAEAVPPTTPTTASKGPLGGASPLFGSSVCGAGPLAAASAPEVGGHARGGGHSEVY